MLKIREKLLQARGLEKEYQMKHSLGQYNAQSEFTKKLKQIGIQSIPEYHELVVTEGYKGRTFRIKRVSQDTLKQDLLQAIERQEDTLLLSIYKKTVIQINVGGTIPKCVDKDFCEEKGIPFIPFMRVSKCAFLYAIGDCPMYFVVTLPIQYNLGRIIQQALVTVLKEHYGLDAEIDHNDVVVRTDKGIEKVFSWTAYEREGVLVINTGFSLKSKRELCKKVFSGEPHISEKVPSSIEDLTGEELDTEEFKDLFIEKLEEVTESVFIQ